MLSVRFSIAGLMGAVLIAALGLVALRSVSETTAGIALLVTCGVLGLAVVGAICRDAAERAWWLGFAVFGWGYLALAFWSPSNETTLPTLTGLAALCRRVGLEVTTLETAPGIEIDPSFVRIGHFLLALIAASLGGTLAAILFAARGAGSPGQANEADHESRSTMRPIWRRRSTAIGLSGVGAAGTVVVIGSLGTGPLWAGLVFLTTCVLLALAVLGALIGKGRSREMWLGAALFGWGYMVLAFAWHPFHAACPYLVTGQWLDHFRPSFPAKLSGFPPCDDRTEPANARILSALELPVPMHFRTPTELQALLKYIKGATAGSDGKGIPCYVDPIGLQEAEQSMTSTVHLDLENIPLKASLQMCLRQLGLTYMVKDGFLMITSASATDVEILPIFENPFIIVGHSVIALIAAGLGAIAAPVVAGRNQSGTN